MAKLLARRALQGVVIVWLVATLTFLLLALAPGDAVDAAYGDSRVPQETRGVLRAQFCLDRDIAGRYVCWIGSIAHGNFGWSIRYMRPVGEMLADAVPNTLVLMFCAITLTFALGVGAGVLQARRPGGAVDRGVGAGALFLYALPDFWFALMVMLVVANTIPSLPISGMTDVALYPAYGFWGKLGDRLAHLVLPAGTLALVAAAGISRYQRAAMLDAMSQDFVRTARAKGVDEGRILRHHVFRNALLPVITLLGLWLPALLGGAVIIERIFAWPGIGALAANGVATRDAPLVLAITILSSVLVVLGSLLADLLYAVADPRVRVE
jgi:peptide/nickel transport system permease protein